MKKIIKVKSSDNKELKITPIDPILSMHVETKPLDEVKKDNEGIRLIVEL